MKIEKVEKKGLGNVGQMIAKEFPYVKRSAKETQSALLLGKISIFNAVEQGKVLGFVEMQFLGESVARINGLSVKGNARGKGIGGKLLDFSIGFLEKKGVERIILLVKESNTAAKALYKSRGFSFIGLHQRDIEGSVVEELELNLGSAPLPYVS